MEKGIYTSKLKEDCGKYLEKLRDKYKTGGIWICERLGRRISFVCGKEPDDIKPYDKIDIDENFILFVENKSDLINDIDVILLKLKEILYED